MEQSMHITTLAPETAGRFLEKNCTNRNLRLSEVAKYQRDMENDNWKLCPHPIIVTDTGRLLDGQHRCCAVVKSGREIPVWLHVQKDIGQQPMDLMVDQGVRRSQSDMTGILRGYHDVGNTLFRIHNKNSFPTTHESKLLAEYIQVVEPKDLCVRRRERCGGSAAALGFLCAFYEYDDTDYVKEQFNLICSKDWQNLSRYAFRYIMSVNEKRLPTNNYARFLAAFKACDPKNKDLQKFFIRGDVKEQAIEKSKFVWEGFQEQNGNVP